MAISSLPPVTYLVSLPASSLETLPAADQTFTSASAVCPNSAVTAPRSTEPSGSDGSRPVSIACMPSVIDRVAFSCASSRALLWFSQNSDKALAYSDALMTRTR